MKGAIDASLNSSAKKYYIAQWSEREDAEGKHEMAMRQKKGKSSSYSAASTNLAERSANTNF
ncbi:hypothetical protein H5410_004463 [Solanum commersonii]|uniref:Uncharacterized protein n=1 Tax=Solanum commersonii TaxID=4109 RepID=A0A9J6B835_SOLCO|nr:hypothetical protein H5410_004463 [Solanum commersonii]